VYIYRRPRQPETAIICNKSRGRCFSKITSGVRAPYLSLSISSRPLNWLNFRHNLKPHSISRAPTRATLFTWLLKAPVSERAPTPFYWVHQFVIYTHAARNVEFEWERRRLWSTAAVCRVFAYITRTHAGASFITHKHTTPPSVLISLFGRAREEHVLVHEFFANNLFDLLLNSKLYYAICHGGQVKWNWICELLQRLRSKIISRVRSFYSHKSF
jgi:hypothetical protein